MNYLLDVIKEGLKQVAIYAEVDLKDAFIFIARKDLNDCKGVDFNNIVVGNTYDSIAYNEKVLRLIRNHEKVNSKVVETVLAEMKSPRGAIIGYLVIDNKYKVNIRGGDEMITRINNESIICTNGSPTLRTFVGLNTLDISNRVKDVEITKDEISKIYLKYKDGVKFN